ncbi:MFS transporter [Fictibacillus gelatini]|uniref:MFS transporter n=1 Tax=Fictibacillus gelatini TaxID=225985 RepID=UPI0003FC7534|nr:MFS transporter [Fictibacillus gelatini]
MNILTQNQGKVNLTIFSISKFLSALGGNIYAFGMGLYILSLTGSAGNFAIGMACSAVPRILVGPVAGAWADRFSRKKIIILTQLIEVLTLGGFFVISFLIEISLPLIYGTTAILSVCSTFSSITFSSSIPDLVNEGQIQKATSLNQSAISLATIGAPIIGGLLYGVLSIQTFIAINAVAYLFSAALDSFLKFEKPDLGDNLNSEQTRNIWVEIKEGFTYVQSNYLLYKVILPVGLWVNFFGVSMQVGLPYIVVQRLKLISYQFGLIEASLAIGMLLMSIFLSTREETRKPLITMRISLIILSFLLGMMAIPLLLPASSSFNFVYYLGLLLAFGLTIVFLNTPLYVLVQKTTPEQYRGRVFGLVETVANVIAPISMIFYGFLFDYLNPVWILFASGLVLFLITIYKMRVSKIQKSSSEISSAL